MSTDTDRVCEARIAELTSDVKELHVGLNNVEKQNLSCKLEHNQQLNEMKEELKEALAKMTTLLLDRINVMQDSITKLEERHSALKGRMAIYVAIGSLLGSGLISSIFAVGLKIVSP